MATKSIRELMGDRPVHTVAPGDVLRDVARRMATEKVGAVAVVDEGDLVGIVSERDIVFRGVGQGLASDTATAAEVMTRDPVTVQMDDAISDALAAKLGNKFRHLPVMDGDRLAGLLSYREIPAEYIMLFERFREMSTAHADDDA
ncbi:CBS domain-containing protein [uncultured Shimia sp.]|uniref:CBS domain-containing protein n=1 Tax=uncultured Shimia sp. TaxID=573152 RepID=UPI00263507A5|nr:CBS domain-containing protein [uncultured Shimia sp.]